MKKRDNPARGSSLFFHTRVKRTGYVFRLIECSGIDPYRSRTGEKEAKT